MSKHQLPSEINLIYNLFIYCAYTIIFNCSSDSYRRASVKRTCSDIINMSNKKPPVPVMNHRNNANKFYILLPLSNKFQPFVTNNSDDINLNRNEGKPKKNRILPIVASSTNAKLVHDLMSQLKIVQYNIQLISIGIKMYCYNIAIH